MTVTCHAIAVSFVIPKSRGTGFVRALPAVPPAFTFVGAGLRPAPLRMPRTASSIPTSPSARVISANVDVQWGTCAN